VKGDSIVKVLSRYARTFVTALGASFVVLAIAGGFAAFGDDTGPSFASFLTPGGAIVAAGIATAFIEVIKASIPVVGNAVSGALMAFILTAILYVFTALAVGVATPDDGLNIFLAWLTCSTSAIGIKSVTGHVAHVKAGTAGAPPEGTETGGSV
jgi:hypothetical protein